MHMSSDILRDSIFWVEVDRIKPNPYQPRREFDQLKLQELADSIRMYGLLQPLTVTRKEIPREDGGLLVEYELIAGERRLRASKLSGLTQVPVIIRIGEETDQMKLELAIIENLQREDLNPIDRAKAFHRLHHEFHFSHGDIGRKVGKSREYVTNTLRLLTLPEEILGFLGEGRITEGHTRPLLMLNDKPEEQRVLVREVMLKKLSVREAETIARRSAQDKVSARYKIDPEILAMERALTERLGTRVTIEPREVGGRVVISFFSADDLQTLLDSMRMERDAEALGHIFSAVEKEGTATLTEAAGGDDVRAQLGDVLVANDETGIELPGAAVLSDEASVQLADVVATNDETGTELPEVAALSDEASVQLADVSEVAIVTVPEELMSPFVAVSSEPIAAMEPAFAVPQAPLTPEARTEPALEDDSDLYAIRNFSI